MTNLEQFKKIKNVSVILNNAGSANHIIHTLKNLNKFDLKVYASNPGKKIWVNNFGHKCLVNSVDKLIDNCNLLLIGTGFPEGELDILERIKRNNIPSIGILDHWVNYKIRFLNKGKYIYPDTLWVLDEYALKIAKNIFKDKTSIVQIPNYYLKNTLKSVSKVKKKQGQILYLSEPLMENWNKNGNCNKEAICFCLQKLSEGKLGKIKHFILRLHPSQNKNTFNWLMYQNYPFKISIDDEIDLSKSIGKSEFVIGSETYALSIAINAKKKTFCSLPPWAPKSKLPHKEMIYIRDL